MTAAVRLESVTERDRFEELAGNPFLDQVVDANRLYLAAAVRDAVASERGRWVLSCLPATDGGVRFSTLGIGGQEAFATFKPGADGVLMAQIFVSESVLKSFGAEFVRRDLRLLASADDQVGVYGSWPDLAPELASRPLRTAARALAERLLPARSGYSTAHSDGLAGRVLGRI